MYFEFIHLIFFNIWGTKILFCVFVCDFNLTIHLMKIRHSNKGIFDYGICV
jgi:hypothetical protein